MPDATKSHSSLLSYIEAATRADSKEDLLSQIVSACIANVGCDSCDILYREPGDGLVLRASSAFPELNIFL